MIGEGWTKSGIEKSSLHFSRNGMFFCSVSFHFSREWEPRMGMKLRGSLCMHKELHSWGRGLGRGRVLSTKITYDSRNFVKSCKHKTVPMMAVGWIPLSADIGMRPNYRHNCNQVTVITSKPRVLLLRVQISWRLWNPAPMTTCILHATQLQKYLVGKPCDANHK